MKRFLCSRAFLLAMPLLLLGSMYVVYNWAVAALGPKLGYFAGFVVY